MSAPVIDVAAAHRVELATRRYLFRRCMIAYYALLAPERYQFWRARTNPFAVDARKAA